MKSYALVHVTEDYSTVKILRGNREEGLVKFKELVREVVNCSVTTCVSFVELENDGTGEIEMGFDITGPGESYTFDVENNYYDEDEWNCSIPEMTFDKFYESWLEDNIL